MPAFSTWEDSRGLTGIPVGENRRLPVDSADAAGATFTAGAALTACAIAVRIRVEALAVAWTVTAVVGAGFHPNAVDLSFAHAQRRAVPIEILELAMLAVCKLDDHV